MCDVLNISKGIPTRFSDCPPAAPEAFQSTAAGRKPTGTQTDSSSDNPSVCNGLCETGLLKMHLTFLNLTDSRYGLQVLAEG